MAHASLSDRLQAFIDAAAKKHNGKNDYSHVAATFVNAHTKVTITCFDHGDFDQTPNEHRRGQRCPDCSGRRGSRPEARRQQFIDQARIIHGDRYDYRNVVYVDQHTPVIITCRAHGVFSQRPTNHLDIDTPSNCLRCAQDARDAHMRTAWRTRTPQPRKKRTGKFTKAA
jgi:hypothetical protein